jgi:peptidoglycan DL-endopeptidase CwlO
MTFRGTASGTGDVGGEQMATVRHQQVRRDRPWWRPLTYSAATATALAALFNPLPAAASPEVPAAPPAAPAVPAVPDPGMRPLPLGTLVMPGLPASATAATTPVINPAVPMTPLLRKLEKQRNEIAKLGDELIKLGQDRDLARQQISTAAQRVSDLQAALIKAKQEAAAAAAAALRDQAALPPGTLGSGLADLDALSRLQRGESISEEAASRQLAILQAELTAATAQQDTATTDATDYAAKYGKLKAQIDKKQAALQKLEQQHSDEISAAEAAESAADRALGTEYLRGAADGRGADSRALAALDYALDQIGDPYVWSEEGPDQYDCSGLMFAAYRRAQAGNFPLQRVSRDQYWQTHLKTVDRYSLLPGDLLFFSSSSSWQDIHHVAMYAGRGMMVEAPRTGLDVRLVPVRWTRLFSATRVYGSVDGITREPDLSGRPTGDGDGATTPPTTTKPPTTSKPPTTTKPPTSTPPTSSGSPSAPPSSSSPPPSSSSPPPSSSGSTTPATNPTPTTGTPSGGSTSPSGGGESSSGGGSSPTGSEDASSPTGSASESASKTAEASSSASSSSASSSTSASSSSTSASSSSTSASSASSSAASATKSAAASASASGDPE